VEEQNKFNHSTHLTNDLRVPNSEMLHFSLENISGDDSVLRAIAQHGKFSTVDKMKAEK
jgi:hypothetical protein